MEKIEEIIFEHEPMVLSISEANLRSETDVSKVRINNYEMLTVRAIRNPSISVSRIVVYDRNDILFTRRLGE